MTRKTHHVVPNPDGGWDVKKGGGERSIKHFDKKKMLLILVGTLVKTKVRNL
jgi:hypothetical protein